MARLEPNLRSHCQFAQQSASAGLAAARRAMNAVRTATPADNRPLTERLAERVPRGSPPPPPQTTILFLGKKTRVFLSSFDANPRRPSEVPIPPGGPSSGFSV